VKRLTIVVPAYNEAENLPELVGRIRSASANLRNWSNEILVVDDGSTDGTAAAAAGLSTPAGPVVVLRLSRNFGHQAAIEAGLARAGGDAVITMDADLQHPPEEIPGMVREHEEGADVVQMVRRRSAAGSKGLWSRSFYRVFGLLADTSIIPDAADFRLLSRRALDALNRIPEREKFLRGLVPMLGFRQVALQFDEADRSAGRPAFSFRRSWRLGRKALLDFSTVPLRLVLWAGLGLALLSFLFGVGHVTWKLISWRSVAPGFTDIITAVLFLSGCILATLGVIGHYLMLILEQVRGRPWYIVAEEIPAGPEPETAASPGTGPRPHS
jgi:glycosyltransferase involved in cell wall biosynthesis